MSSFTSIPSNKDYFGDAGSLQATGSKLLLLGTALQMGANGLFNNTNHVAIELGSFLQSNNIPTALVGLGAAAFLYSGHKYSQARQENSQTNTHTNNVGHGTSVVGKALEAAGLIAMDPAAGTVALATGGAFLHADAKVSNIVQSSKKPDDKAKKTYTADDIQKMKEKELKAIIDEQGLKVDLADFTKLNRQQAAVINALDEKGLITQGTDHWQHLRPLMGPTTTGVVQIATWVFDLVKLAHKGVAKFGPIAGRALTGGAAAEIIRENLVAHPQPISAALHSILPTAVIAANSIWAVSDIKQMKRANATTTDLTVQPRDRSNRDRPVVTVNPPSAPKHPDFRQLRSANPPPSSPPSKALPPASPPRRALPPSPRV